MTVTFTREPFSHHRENGLHLAHRFVVTRELPIGHQENHASSDGLGQEKAIEGIFVKRRQAMHVHSMFAGDEKLRVTVINQRAAQNAGISSKVFTPEGALDRNLSQAPTASPATRCVRARTRCVRVRTQCVHARTPCVRARTPCVRARTSCVRARTSWTLGAQGRGGKSAGSDLRTLGSAIK